MYDYVQPKQKQKKKESKPLNNKHIYRSGQNDINPIVQCAKECVITKKKIGFHKKGEDNKEDRKQLTKIPAYAALDIDKENGWDRSNKGGRS